MGEIKQGHSLDKQKQREKIRIILADDHPLLRKALRDTLEEHDDFQIVAEVDDGQEAINRTIELVPDVVIMDITMPRLNGVEATRQIKQKCPSVAVLVLTVHNDIEQIIGIMESGAAGYLTKSVFDQEIVAAIRSVVIGETVLATPIFNQILKHTQRFLSRPVDASGCDKLTNREIEVLRLAMEGLSNRDIAHHLDLTPGTIKSYMVEIFSKLNVGSRTEAVIKGLRAGLFNINDTV